MTKTASVASCPGKCIHALASLMCDTVLEEVRPHVIMTSNFDFIGCHLLIYQISLICLVSLHTLIFTALRNSILILFPGTMSHKQYEVLRREKWWWFLLLGILDTRTWLVDASKVKTSSLFFCLVVQFFINKDILLFGLNSSIDIFIDSSKSLQTVRIAAKEG